MSASNIEDTDVVVENDEVDELLVAGDDAITMSPELIREFDISESSGSIWAKESKI